MPLLFRKCISAQDTRILRFTSYCSLWMRVLLSFSLRSIHLSYVKDVEVKGIHAYRFAPPNDVLMNPKDNPTNAGFCVPAGDCLGTGVLKVSVCRDGTTRPTYLTPWSSYPSPPLWSASFSFFCLRPSFTKRTTSLRSVTSSPGLSDISEHVRFYSTAGQWLTVLIVFGGYEGFLWRSLSRVGLL